MESFLNEFKITSRLTLVNDGDLFKSLPKGFFTLVDMFGGATFNNGTYRIHSFNSSVKWSLLLGEYFTSYKNKIYPFGFDWMGRQFCINENDSSIFMFDPATLEDFKLNNNIVQFHNEDLVNGLLGGDLFKNTLTFCNLKEISFYECIGHKRPVFLGGEDIIENNEKQNIDVYWHMQFNLYEKTKDLPEGVVIGNINIE